MHASSTVPIVPSILPPWPGSASAQIYQLLAQVDAMQAELDRLREQSDARRYHMEQVERELKLAARLQRDFLPKRLPNHGRIKFNRLYRPVGHVSGDLYDVRRLDEQHAGVYLTDAIGHGMPAALLAMFMHNALQTKRIEGDGSYCLLPSEDVMRLLNEALCGQELAHTTFATAIYARVNFETGEIDFARGGHPLPMLIRRGEIREIGGRGALLGVMPEEVFEPVSLTLEPGDRLIFFTDGVETLFVPRGAPPGMNSWRKAMRKRRNMTADDLLADLWQHIESRGGATDDVTVVTLEME